ncbi:DUF4333 domain-containing protein [Actinokineospora sp. G85]|uniref:DUF4333 domain-containing protein n=1 Tax=Actinokineospora sp. G85 TaxID=3406626 RepID=UPI003C7694D9
MSSPYGPSGGQDPQQPWGQQPYGANPPGTPSGGFPQQGQPQPGQSPYPPEQGQYGYQQPQPTQQQPQYGQQPTQQGYGAPPQQGYGPPTGQQPQYGGYNPNQQPYPGGASAKKSNAGIWIAVVAVVLLVGVGAVLAFVAPGFANKTVFDQSAVQDGVKGILTGKYSVENVESVTCPADQEVRAGNKFTCEATIGGEKRTVSITVRTDDGEYEVAPPSDG